MLGFECKIGEKFEVRLNWVIVEQGGNAAKRGGVHSTIEDREESAKGGDGQLKATDRVLKHLN